MNGEFQTEEFQAYISVISITAGIVFTVFAGTKIAYNVAKNAFARHRHQFEVQLLEASGQMSRVLENTAAYIANMDKIEQFASKASRQRTTAGEQPGPSVPHYTRAVIHRPRSSVRRRVSVDVTDSMINEYKMQNIVPPPVTKELKRAISLRALNLTGGCAGSRDGNTVICNDDICPFHGHQNRLLNRFGADVGLHGNFKAPENLLSPNSPYGQMKTFSYSSMPRNN